MTNLTRITILWGLLFAVVHFYWAAGGEAGMRGEPADTLAAQLYIGFIAALGLAGAAVAHRRHAILARAAGAVVLLGVAIGAGRWLAHGSAVGAADATITVYFLLGGLLFSVLGWLRTRQGAEARRASSAHGTAST
jgi:hypothetical protein